jgi:site-specific recombinase XerD
MAISRPTTPLMVTPMPPGTALTTLLDDDLSAARDFQASSKAQATIRAYRGDFAIFTAYCSERGLSPLPASVEAVTAFLSASARGGAKASTLGRRVAAIRFAHKAAGFEPVTNNEEVRATMAGIRREIGAAKQGRAPATSDIISQMLGACRDDLRGLRDRALIAFGFATALRRSELVALQVSDIEHCPEGLRVMIRRSKTDQTGEGATIAVPHGTRLLPVEHLRRWLAAAGISDGPLFREVSKGQVGAEALSAQVVSLRTKRLLRLCGIDPALYAAHSLRSGYITSAARSGASIWKLADQSRHRSLDTLKGYVRDGQLFVDHSGSLFL